MLACILFVWLKLFRVFEAKSVWTEIVHKGGAAASEAVWLATGHITVTHHTGGISVAPGWMTLARIASVLGILLVIAQTWQFATTVGFLGILLWSAQQSHCVGIAGSLVMLRVNVLMIPFVTHAANLVTSPGIVRLQSFPLETLGFATIVTNKDI